MTKETASRALNSLDVNVTSFALRREVTMVRSASWSRGTQRRGAPNQTGQAFPGRPAGDPGGKNHRMPRRPLQLTEAERRELEEMQERLCEADRKAAPLFYQQVFLDEADEETLAAHLLPDELKYVLDCRRAQGTEEGP